MPEIEGKVVAITGASSGIGEATALLLARQGAKVVLGAVMPPTSRPMLSGVRTFPPLSLWPASGTAGWMFSSATPASGRLLPSTICGSKSGTR